MGIVDYLSRKPNGEPWPETASDKNFVAISIGNFYKALYCLSSRLNNTGGSTGKIFLEHSEAKTDLSQKNDMSSRWVAMVTKTVR